MKIQYMSDLHLEFLENTKFIKSLEIPITGDVLVLAGDTAYLSDKKKHRWFWKWASDAYRQVLLVPGNHEYYGYSNVTAYGDNWREMLLPNVGYYQNQVVRIDDIDFILSTLWSHIRPQDEYFVARGMNDFRQIRYGDSRFTTDDFNIEHNKCLSFIKKAVSDSHAEKRVVVTHHLPSYQVVAPCHKGDSLTSAFATELGDYIAGSRIDAWIFGHSHSNVCAKIGETQLICNQMGYVEHSECEKGFDPSRYYEL